MVCVYCACFVLICKLMIRLEANDLRYSSSRFYSLLDMCINLDGLDGISAKVDISALYGLGYGYGYG